MDKQKYWFFGSKLNTALLVILIVLMVIALKWMSHDKGKYFPKNEAPGETLQEGEDKDVVVKDTYTYTNHGFSIELPNGFVPKVILEKPPVMSFPGGYMTYIVDATQEEKNLAKDYKYIDDIKIGETNFKHYTYDNTDTIQDIYWFKKGSVGYEYEGDPKILETFKFIGWPQTNVTGKAQTTDLVSFSILPGTEVHGVLSYRGVIKGAYFFEGNVLINILDSNKKVLKSSNAVSTTDWMTAGPVSFEGNIDFGGLPKGPAYFEIHNDNASGLPENDKSILIPIVIK